MANECIIWEQKYRDKDGYGTKCVDGKPVRVHRYFYEKACGKIPKGMVIDHLCKTRDCINTDHMEVVTSRINTQRKITAKLNHQKADRIRKLYKTGDYTQSQLGKIYNVGQDEVSRVIHYRRWM